MATTKVIVRHGEAARNVVNHKGRGDSRPALTAEGIAAYEMPMDELRSKADAQLKTSHWIDSTPQVQAEMTVWMESRPEYANIDKRNDKTAKANADAMLVELYSPEGKTAMRHAQRTVPSFWDFEMAFTRASTKGTLVLDESEIQKRQFGQVRARVSGQVELDPETMPMDQLRQLANGIFDPLGPRG